MLDHSLYPTSVFWNHKFLSSTIVCQRIAHIDTLFFQISHQYKDTLTKNLDQNILPHYCLNAKHVLNLPSRYTTDQAKIAQLVEHNLAKVGVASSNLVFRSRVYSQSIFNILGSWKCKTQDLRPVI